jgi:cytochrome b561
VRTEPDRFSNLQRVLHWLMAIIVIAMLFIGVSMVSTLTPSFLTLISVHKPLGIAILALAVLRLGVRLRLGAPPLPDDLPWKLKRWRQSSRILCSMRS